MKTLKKFEFPETKGGFKSRYDWDKLLSGSILQLEEGKDYSCKIHTFGMMARKQAAKRGMTVRVAKIEGGLVLQAIPAAADEGTTETVPTE